MKTTATHPVKIIALCVMMLFTVTLISFSQTSQNGQEYGEMNTPRQERWFDITNLEGRTITAVVVGFNEEAIAIRVSNNASIAYIPWENLDEATIATLFKGSIRPRATASTIVKTAAVMPYQTTITDKQGRSIKGDILGKSNTAITFQREGETTNFEVQIATLSDENQEMIAELINTAPITDKPTVLFYHDGNYERISDRVILLQKNGFHVTIGYTYSGGELSTKRVDDLKKHYDVPKEIDAIIIAPLSASDQYDFLWVGSLHINSVRSTNQDPNPEFNGDVVISHRNAKNGIIIMATYSTEANKRHWTEGKRHRWRTQKNNYVKVDENWIFYWDSVNPDPQEKTRALERVIQTMKNMPQ